MAARARERAWLKPRWIVLPRWSGTGTTSISAGASGASSAMASASMLPSRGRQGCMRSYLSAWMAARMRPVIGPEGDGANKGRRHEPADPAEARRSRALFSGGDGRASRRSDAQTRSADGRKFAPAGITNWHGRELRQRGAAESAGGRKKGATNGIHRTSEHARHGAPAGSLRERTVDRQ